MNLKDQLQTMANGKNASYSAIADYLLARKSYAGLKLKEVAHACHVSDATVVRFCQNLGFDGFSDLKYNLTNEVPAEKGHYFAMFTISNVVFLAILMGAWAMT